MLKVTEIFKSLQGESTHSGRLCTFVRLCGCNLRCNYCDTTYAFEEGKKISVNDILEKVNSLGSPLVEITGGEPLCQKETAHLCKKLLDKGYEVLIETNGSQDISILPSKIKRIVDIKCPESGSFESFLKSNLKHLNNNDECKFIISSKYDFHWACEFIEEFNLAKICTTIFSPNTQQILPVQLAELMINKNSPARLGIQIHKIIWGEKKGV